MNYGSVNLELVERVFDKLGGMRGASRLLSGEAELRTVRAHYWKIWKTINLGTGHKTAADFVESIRQAGMKVGDWLGSIFDASEIASQFHEIDLVLVRPEDMGSDLKNGADEREFYERVEEIGLDRCPTEVGPQLRLQYADQPRGETIIVPTVGFDFVVRHAPEGLCLRQRTQAPIKGEKFSGFILPGSLLVFCGRRYYEKSLGALFLKK